MSSRDVDGGWAWIVLGASYFNQLVCAGLAFVAGMFQVIFLEEFNGSVAFTAWVTGVFSALLQLAGPLASSVSNVFGCRTSVILGGGLLSTGFFISGLMDRLEWLLVSFGVVAGLGMGMIYIPSIVVVNYYFVKKRSLVNGIVSSAGGLGILLAPQISQLLFENYSWREALFILAGISAHICIAGALMFPVHEKPITKNLMCFRKSREKECYDDDHIKPLQSGDVDTGDYKNCEINIDIIEMDDTTVYNNNRFSNACNDGTKIQEMCNDIVESPLNLYTKDINETNGKNDNINVAQEEEQIIDNPRLESTKYPSLYKNGSFLILCLTMFVNSAGSGCFLIHVPSFLHAQNLSRREVTNILSVNGMSILFGRCLVGALVSSQPGNEVLFLIALQIIGGTFMMLFPVFATSFASCAGFMFIAAAYCGTFYSLLPTLTIQYVGLDGLSTAFGIEMVCSGVGYLISPPLSGMAVDLTGNYDINMYGGGVLFIIAGLTSMVLPGMSKEMEIKRKERYKS